MYIILFLYGGYPAVGTPRRARRTSYYTKYYKYANTRHKTDVKMSWVARKSFGKPSAVP